MDLVSTLNRIAGSQNIRLDQDKLDKDIDDVLDFDHDLALKYSTDDTTRRQFERSFNPMTLAELQSKYPKISWELYISEVFQLVPDVKQKVLKASDYHYIVTEPKMLQLLSDNVEAVPTRTLVNYIYAKLVMAYSDFLPVSFKNLKISFLLLQTF
ncbi:unnamed protein product [Strongylus vulgaris]|uniref:Peptidase M13 N-terminal domain-containing protein n=1 Tax=Strongylus vulgaris TaxID=40348 RepID=A0A3P7J3F7_STRVU|nr:unnamed protein product [Strongylus vulgaris]